MHDSLWLMLLKNALQFVSVADIHVLEDIAVALTDTSQRFEVAGIGELVDVDNTIVGAGNQVSNDRRANESGATRYQDSQLKISREGVPSLAMPSGMGDAKSYHAANVICVNQPCPVGCAPVVGWWLVNAN